MNGKEGGKVSLHSFGSTANYAMGIRKKEKQNGRWILKAELLDDFTM